MINRIAYGAGVLAGLVGFLGTMLWLEGFFA